MNIEEKAWRYVNKAFADSSDWDKERIVRDWLSKERKTKGLIEDFEKRVGKIKGKEVLELGFGSGIQMLVFSKTGAKMHGLEVDKVLYDISKEVLVDTDIDARMYDGKRFPYSDNYFDFCYSTSVLEHVNDVPCVLREMYRTLKPGGRAYISFPNRWWLKETHTGIYFLSFLPRNMASFIVRTIFKRHAVDEWNLHFLSYFSFKKALKRNDIPFRILMESDSSNFFKRIIKKVLSFMGIHHSAVLRTVMVILEKKM